MRFYDIQEMFAKCNYDVPTTFYAFMHLFQYKQFFSYNKILTDYIISLKPCFEDIFNELSYQSMKLAR